MPIRRSICTVRGLSLVTLALACASGGTTADAVETPEGGAEQGTAVTILNNSPGAATMTFYMVPEFGVDTPLGSVDAGQSRTFAFDGNPGFYQIRALGPAGESRSERFQLFRNSLVRWDMAAGRRVTVGRRG